MEVGWLTSGRGIEKDGTSLLPAVLGRLVLGSCRGRRGDGGRPLYDECPFVTPFPFAASCGGVKGKRRPLPRDKWGVDRYVLNVLTNRNSHASGDTLHLTERPDSTVS